MTNDMSLKGTRGTSLTEVMVMMVILGISIVGIYSMVNSGRELATLTDTRLTAINIAREGLESVATLRDTFGLKGYESGSCGGTLDPAFFSIDEDILTSTPPINCPQTSATYILDDNKTLLEKIPNSDSFEVCINEFGWYSQEYSVKTNDPPTTTQTSCASTTILCGGNITQSCKTKFEREITFKSDNTSGCVGIEDTEFCLEVISKVTWGGASTDETLELSQIMTPLD